MSDHADTIRYAREVLDGVPGGRWAGVDRELAKGVMALLAEIERLRDALEQIARANLSPMFGPTTPRLQQMASAALAAVRVEDER